MVAFGGAAFAVVVELVGPEVDAVGVVPEKGAFPPELALVVLAEGASTPDVVATGVGPIDPLLVVVAGPSRDDA